MTSWKDVLISRFPRQILPADDPRTRRLGWDSSAITEFRDIHLHDLPDTGFVIQPSGADDICEVIRLARSWHIPVSARGGGSGVVQALYPDPDSIVLDLSKLSSIGPLDAINGQITVEAGVSARVLEDGLREQGWTLGHFPQSIDQASMGGLIATKSIGQYSTHYGGIESMVRQLTVVTGNGDILHLGHRTPRRTAGPELLPFFIGSEGTLGIITEATLKVWPLPESEAGLTVVVPEFSRGLYLMRRWLQSGLSPSVLRLYDTAEARRTFGLENGSPLLLALFHGPQAITQASIRVASSLIEGLGSIGDETLIQQWFSHRNDVSAWRPLLAQGIIADTIEVSACWSQLDALYSEVIATIAAMPGIIGITGHSSHAYSDGANLYFTFLLDPGSPQLASDKYLAVWNAVLGIAQQQKASGSHHHGVGRLRLESTFQERAEEMPYLLSLRKQFDPGGILNRGALWKIP